jgi:hypothetical protein
VNYKQKREKNKGGFFYFLNIQYFGYVDRLEASGYDIFTGWTE